MDAKITGDEILHEGRFLALRRKSFIDDRGVARTWESADRVNSRGAVLIAACIVPDDEIVLVRQFRPPTGKVVVELPAGLIDPGETPASTAVRELYEETGYAGKLLDVTPAGYSSPGMSGEAVYIAFMEIDGDAYRGKAVVAHPEECESIECIRVPRAKLADFLLEENRIGHGVDTKLYLYAQALKK